MKNCFLFPGQGAQYPGMGKDLYQHSDKVKSLFECASDSTGVDVKKLLFEGSADELKQTDNTQIAVTLVNLSTAEVLRQKGIEAEGCAGFSLGEYAALVYTGVLTAEQVFPMVRKRGQFMAEAGKKLDRSAGNPGMSAVLGLPPENVENIINESGIPDLFIANYNSPSQVVLSGTAKALDTGDTVLKEKGAKRVIRLRVSGPFHCPLLEEARSLFSEYVSGLEFKAPSLALFSNVTGSRMESGSDVKELAVKQIISPVRWIFEESAILDAGFTNCYEPGPGKVVSGLWKAFTREVPCIPVGTMDDIQTLIQ